ncbi:MAG: 2-hydroxyacid dehydrogenase [Clostridiales Family XIII bacterium]|nr:2-hydroxyacid dehydrogenase [Clostridiales Family XIII bacterium]
MLDFLYEQPLKTVIIGDVRLTPETMEAALKNSPIKMREVSHVFWGEKEDTGAFSVRQLNLERNGSDAEPYAPELDEAILDAELIMVHMCPIPQKLLEKAKNLRAILICRGGVENVNAACAGELGIPVINVIRNAVSVAEFALGLILSATRNIAESHHQIRSGVWTRDYPNADYIRTLENLTVGLVGVGNMGIELATRLKALNVPMKFYDEYINRERLKTSGLGDVEVVDSLDTLFRECDIISLHLRLTEENVGQINARYFEQMKPTAYFVNTARGGLINQDDLVSVLKAKKIAGAALDVFDSEPLRKDSGLAELDNVVLTAHIAGTTYDALNNSPVQLLREVDRIVKNGATERIVNYRQLSL